MLNLTDILSYYPPVFQTRQKHVLREYLQYEILEYIFRHAYASKLVFIGGTALRIVYGDPRFSEDLDFDNFDLSQDEFALMMEDLVKYLKKNGYEVEMKLVYKGAYNCHIKLPGILFANNLATMKTEKILIKIDTFGQGYTFEPVVRVIEKFHFTFPLRVASPQLLLAHKFFAFFEREKGRDVFDIVFLLAQTKKPDWGFLEQKCGISDPKILKKKIMQRCNEVDILHLATDVEPFLFNPHDQKVRLFPELLQQIEFEA